MQRLKPGHLQNMTGIEYFLIHVQEPILYVIRKVQRHSPTQSKCHSLTLSRQDLKIMALKNYIAFIKLIFNISQHQQFAITIYLTVQFIKLLIYARS